MQRDALRWCHDNLLAGALESTAARERVHPPAERLSTETGVRLQVARSAEGDRGVPDE
jgi:hypothetical protein